METSIRQQIQQEILAKRQQVKDLGYAILLLQRKDMLHSDEQQWWSEVEEERVISKRPKRTEKVLLGRIHWNEDYVDESDGHIVVVERSQVVRENGVWL